MKPWSKFAYALLKFAFRYCGASLDTLIAICNMDSGMIYMSGRGGGYELKNTLKLGWQLL